MTHATAKPLTISAAKAAARELGFTLRKTTPGESELALYRVGTGIDAPHAYFTDCPADALATARAMAADYDAGRITLTGRPATAAAFATIAAEDNRKAAADYAADYDGAASSAAAVARGFMADAREALATAADAPGAYDATAAHYDACRAAELADVARKLARGKAPRAELAELADVARAMAAFHAEAMALAYAAEAKPRPAPEPVGIAGVPSSLNGRPVGRAVAHGNGFATVMTTAPEPGAGAAYCVATYWPGLGNGWTWGHYSESREGMESAWADVMARNESRGPRSLSAAANPDAPRTLRQLRRDAARAKLADAIERGRPGDSLAPSPRRRIMARNRAELAGQLADAIATHGPDSLAAELAAGGLAAAAGGRASGGFPLYAFRDGSAYDADGLDSLAYGHATGGLI